MVIGKGESVRKYIHVIISYTAVIRTFRGDDSTHPPITVSSDGPDSPFINSAEKWERSGIRVYNDEGKMG